MTVTKNLKSLDLHMAIAYENERAAKKIDSTFTEPYYYVNLSENFGEDEDQVDMYFDTRDHPEKYVQDQPISKLFVEFAYYVCSLTNIKIIACLTDDETLVANDHYTVERDGERY